MRIHRCHTRSQCPIVCQVVTGVIPSSPYLTLTLIFRFGATYVGASKIISMQVCGQKKYLPWISSYPCRRPTQSLVVLLLILQEAYPILIGDMDPSGGLQANIIHAPSGELGWGFSEKMKTKTLNILCTDNLRTKMMVAIQEGKWQNVQITADYKVCQPKLLPNISLLVFCPKVKSFKRFLSGQRLHSFSHYGQPWPSRGHRNGRGPLPSGEKEEDSKKKWNPWLGKADSHFPSLWLPSCLLEQNWPTRQPHRYLVDT